MISSQTSMNELADMKDICIIDFSLMFDTSKRTLPPRTQAVEELAMAAGVYHLPSSTPSVPLFDHETIRQRMKLMKKQHDKVPAGTAVQWVDKYRHEVPNMLVS